MSRRRTGSAGTRWNAFQRTYANERCFAALYTRDSGWPRKAPSPNPSYEQKKITMMPNAEEVIHTCAWCGKRIPENTELFSLGVKLRPGKDVSEHEGGVLSLELMSRARILHAIVPTVDSQIKRAGNDFFFMICSHACAGELRDALEEDKALGDQLSEFGLP